MMSKTGEMLFSRKKRKQRCEERKKNYFEVVCCFNINKRTPVSASTVNYYMF